MVACQPDRSDASSSSGQVARENDSSRALLSKPNPLPRCGRRRHQFSNRLKYDLELRVVLFLELVELLRQVCVRLEHAAKPHERTHDFDVHAHRARTAKHARQHCHALLGEGIWTILAMLPASTL